MAAEKGRGQDIDFYHLTYRIIGFSAQNQIMHSMLKSWPRSFIKSHSINNHTGTTSALRLSPPSEIFSSLKWFSYLKIIIIIKRLIIIMPSLDIFYFCYSWAYARFSHSRILSMVFYFVYDVGVSRKHP